MAHITWPEPLYEAEVKWQGERLTYAVLLQIYSREENKH